MKKEKEIVILEKLLQGGNITRRQFVASMSALGLAAAVSPILLNKQAKAATPKKGGRFRMGLSGGSTSDTLDPATLDEVMNMHVSYCIRQNLVEVDYQGNAVPELAESAPAIRHYHERFDGTGYPQGLKGNLIPLEARIIAVADAYTNLTTETTSRRALTPQEALRELLQLVNTEFDPDVVNALGKTIES